MNKGFTAHRDESSREAHKSENGGDSSDNSAESKCGGGNAKDNSETEAEADVE
jgi:hypothetical protein